MIGVGQNRQREIRMKRLIATLMTLIVLSIAAVPAGAQTRDRRSYRRAAQTRYDARYDSDRSGTDRYLYEEDRSIWEKHRDKITTAGGAVGGAVLGGLLGGKKGAIIGAITGGAGAAVYTYKIRDKNRPY
jgi:hypothetical protein